MMNRNKTIILSVETTIGEKVDITALELQRAVLGYLREHSPNRVKIIAEEKMVDDEEKTVPAAALFLLKNPNEVAYYTDVIPKPKTENKEEILNLK